MNKNKLLLKNVVFSVIFLVIIMSFGFSSEIGLVATLRGHSNLINSLSFSPNGQFLASSASENKIFLWNTSDWEAIYTERDLPIQGKMIISPDNNELVIGTFWPFGYRAAGIRTSILIRNLKNLKINTDKYAFYNASVRSVGFSPNGKLLANGFYFYNKTLGRRLSIFKVWDYDKWELVGNLEYSCNQIEKPFSFSFDEKYFSTTQCPIWENFGCPNARIIVWDTAKWNLVANFSAHNTEIDSLAFSADNNYLASSSCDALGSDCKKGIITLWDTKNWKKIRTFSDHTGEIRNLIFTNDKKYLISGSKDGTVRIRDTTTWKTKSCWPALSVYSMSLSKDDKYLATGGRGAKIKIWDLSEILEKVDATTFCKSTKNPTPTIISDMPEPIPLDQESFIDKNVIGDTCKHNDDCLSKHCKNSVCCKKEENCCVFDKTCPEGEKCSRDYYCVPDNLEKNQKSTSRSPLMIILIALAFLIPLILVVLAIIIFINEVFYDDEEDETEMISEGLLKQGDINVYRGYVREGSYVKLSIKIQNMVNTVVTDVKINLDLPDGLLTIQPKVPYANIGVIEPNEFQSANFRVKPEGKCVDGVVNGIVLYRDYKGNTKNLEIPPMKLVSICPMLEAETLSMDTFLEQMYSGELQSNKAFVRFEGDTADVFEKAKSRVRSLSYYDGEVTKSKGHISAYACYYGKTKYKNFKFVVEILVNGTEDTGCLTIIVYSDEPAILTGFFSEVLDDIQKSINVIEEKNVSSPKICACCGAPIDILACDENGFHCCSHCETISKLQEWNRY